MRLVEVAPLGQSLDENTDTIVACATPYGKGALAIIRLSGTGTKEILRLLVLSNTPINKWISRSLVRGFIVDSNGRHLDEVLCSIMDAPRSYTGEDVAEIYCHGGEGIVKTILELAIEHGARLANPGEFTRRAYENGKLDIIKAQVVQQIIDAHTREELYGACRVLKGELGNQIRKIRENIAETLMFLEATIDFPEEEDVDTRISPRVGELLDQLGKLIDSTRRKIDHIPEVVVSGRINVGKSSIVNKLCSRKVSIVTSEPGTTRDAVEAEVVFGGIRAKIIDTAGQEDGLLKHAADRAAQVVATSKIEQADVLLWVGTDIKQVLKEAPPEKKNRDVILVVNKSDLLSEDEKEDCLAKIIEVKGVMISALTGDGLDLLNDAIKKKLLQQIGPAEGIPISVWQEETIARVRDGISRAAERIRVDAVELAADDLYQARDRVSELLGDGIKEDILDRIFERFCIGK